jgi:hypothetical protein
MDKNEDKKCDDGHHYHPSHPKADKNGCMKNEDMKNEQIKEDFGGSFSIYNAVRCSGQRRLSNTGSLMFIGV